MNQPRIRTNIVYNVLYQLLLIVIPLITAPYISRKLGSEGVGIYSYTSNIATCFALFAMLGLNNYGSRTIASLQNDKKKRSEEFWNIWFLQFIITITVVLIYVVYLFLCPEKYHFIFLIQLFTVLSSATDINWFFFGIEKFKLTVTRNLVIKIITVCSIFLFVNNRNDVWVYTLIMVGGHFFSTLVLWPFLKKEILWVRPTLSKAFSHLKDTFILFLPVIAVTLYKRMDKVMIGILSTMIQTGYYENTEKLINIPLSLITAVGTVMLPRMTFLYANNRNELSGRYIKTTMEAVACVSFALAFGISAIAKDFAPLFFGDDFKDIWPLIMMISITLPIISWANIIRTQYLIPTHKDKIYVVSVWAGAFVNLIINIILIPKYGAMGAVIGTIFAELVVAVYQTFAVKKSLPIVAYLKDGVYYFFASAFMFVCVKLISNIDLSPLALVSLEIISGVVIYIIVCFPHLKKRFPEMFRIKHR